MHPHPFGVGDSIVKMESGLMLFLACCSSLCQCVCYAIGIIPPPSTTRIRDLVGLQGVVASFVDGLIEQVERLVKGLIDPRLMTTWGPSQIWQCYAMFGSIW
jgi:hypothetical protein